MNKGIYWLASYPKSGNTWVRVVMANYMLDGDNPADVNMELNKSIKISRKEFDNFLCLPSSLMNEAQIHLYQPDVFEAFAAKLEEDVYIKIHDAYLLNSEGKAIFPAVATKGVLYLVRNPLDVAVSYAHHNNFDDIEKSIALMNDTSHTLLKQTYTLPSMLPQRMLSWSQHVKSWMNSGLPLHLVRYEDMYQNSYETFYAMFEFLGFEMNEERLRKALRFSSIKELQKQESKNTFCEKPPNMGNFFRKGGIDDYKNVLSVKMIDSIIEHHGDMMQKLGYLDH